MRVYRKKAVYFLLFMMALLLFTFVLSFVDINRERAILGIGLGYRVEGMLVLFLSVVAIVKVVVELYNIKDHREHPKTDGTA